MTAWIEACSAALRKAASLGGLKGVLRPALYGCPQCGTARMVTSAMPLGKCPNCGTQMELLPR